MRPKPDLSSAKVLIKFTHTNMNEIVAKIQEVREQRKQLENKEKELFASFNCIGVNPDSVYNEFLKLKGVDMFSNYNDKKMFVFVCSSICCPTFLIGDRLNSCLRQKLSKLTGLQPSQISHIVSDVRILHKTYKDFKSEADYLYREITRSLTS